jgi:hypothetical protein
MPTKKDELTTPAATGQRPSWLPLTLVAATVLMTLAIFPAASVFATDLGSGCAPDRPAVAHHAGGVPVKPSKGETAPIPCSTATGVRTGEMSMVITSAGTILFEPALKTETTGFPVEVLSSVDQGETWNFVKPSGVPPRSQGDDMNLWLDRQTGRLFWTTTLGPPYANDVPRVDHSDDEGVTWTPSSVPMLYDHTQVFGGPPTKALEHLMQGYPNVVYTVVSGGATCADYGFCGTHITRSLDGGSTWEFPAVALPYPTGCPDPGTLPTGGYGLHGIVGRDGTVYLPFTPCETPYVAISYDEGQTWQLELVADTNTMGWGELSLGMDPQGYLYAAWTNSADRLPYLSVSREHGLQWSTPLMIAAPGVNEAAEPVLVAGANGQVAVSYYGSTNAPLPFPTACAGFSLACPGYYYETWDTYVTETFDAPYSNPLFWSATLNDPAYPTWYGVTPSSVRIDDDTAFDSGSTAGTPGGPSVSGRMDYYAGTMAPDGTAWFGFVQQCPLGMPVLDNPNCPKTLKGTGPDGLFGMVGRLVKP